MVAGGLPDRRPDHAEAVAEMALAMRAEVARRSDPSGQLLTRKRSQVQTLSRPPTRR
jgi:hypothetical protein